jgi:ribonuclease BN (tRNA processing enzyme)
LEGVRVTFLGSGDAFGSGGRLQTCILVEAAKTRFLLDCGASSLIAMKKQGVSGSSISAVLLTHLHGDHFGGIPFFILDAQFSKREEPLLIAGPPGTESRVRAAMEVLFPKSSETSQRFRLDFSELPLSTACAVGSARVTAEPVVHFSGAHSLALRVECSGRTIAYSGDTEWTNSLLTVARGADLFICESYFFDKKVKFHLDYATLIERKGELGCKRIVLTHMSEDMLGRLGDVDVDVEWGEDRKTILI